MGKRQKGRELAMTLLYQVDLRREEYSVVVHETESSNPAFSGKSREFALHLSEGTLNNLQNIDEALLKCARNWTLDRMAAVDRTILRLAAFEIIYDQNTPSEVAINQAIELAKKFSTARSGEFVNGVLDKLAASVKSGNEANKPADSGVDHA